MFLTNRQISTFRFSTHNPPTWLVKNRT